MTGRRRKTRTPEIDQTGQGGRTGSSSSPTNTPEDEEAESPHALVLRAAEEPAGAGEEDSEFTHAHADHPSAGAGGGAVPSPPEARTSSGVWGQGLPQGGGGPRQQPEQDGEASVRFLGEVLRTMQDPGDQRSGWGPAADVDITDKEKKERMAQEQRVHASVRWEAVEDVLRDAYSGGASVHGHARKQAEAWERIHSLLHLTKTRMDLETLTLAGFAAKAASARRGAGLSATGGPRAFSPQPGDVVGDLGSVADCDEAEARAHSVVQQRGQEFVDVMGRFGNPNEARLAAFVGGLQAQRLARAVRFAVTTTDLRKNSRFDGLRMRLQETEERKAERVRQYWRPSEFELCLELVDQPGGTVRPEAQSDIAYFFGRMRVSKPKDIVAAVGAVCRAVHPERGHKLGADLRAIVNEVLDVFDASASGGSLALGDTVLLNEQIVVRMLVEVTMTEHRDAAGAYPHQLAALVEKWQGGAGAEVVTRVALLEAVDALREQGVGIGATKTPPPKAEVVAAVGLPGPMSGGEEARQPRRPKPPRKKDKKQQPAAGAEDDRPRFTPKSVGNLLKPFETRPFVVRSHLQAWIQAESSDTGWLLGISQKAPFPRAEFEALHPDEQSEIKAALPHLVFAAQGLESLSYVSGASAGAGRGACAVGDAKIDTAATKHFMGPLCPFRLPGSERPCAVLARLANGQQVMAEEEADVLLPVAGGAMQLEDVSIVQGMGDTILLSFAALADQGWSLCLGAGGAGGLLALPAGVAHAVVREGNLFRLSLEVGGGQGGQAEVEEQRVAAAEVITEQQAHRTLNHRSGTVLRRQFPPLAAGQKGTRLTKLYDAPAGAGSVQYDCDACCLTKRKRGSVHSSSTSTRPRAAAPGRVLVVDLGFNSELSNQGHSAFFLAVDEFSAFVTIVLLADKTSLTVARAAASTWDFYADRGRVVEMVILDRGAEFIAPTVPGRARPGPTVFQTTMAELGVKLLFSGVNCPHHHATAERWIQQVKSDTAAFLRQANAPAHWWDAALAHSVRVANALVRDGQTQSPTEMVTGMPVDLGAFRPWGTAGHVTIPTPRRGAVMGTPVSEFAILVGKSGDHVGDEYFIPQRQALCHSDEFVPRDGDRAFPAPHEWGEAQLLFGSSGGGGGVGAGRAEDAAREPLLADGSVPVPAPPFESLMAKGRRLLREVPRAGVFRAQPNNPKQPGSASHERYQAIIDSEADTWPKLHALYAERGWRPALVRADLVHDLGRRFRWAGTEPGQLAAEDRTELLRDDEQLVSWISDQAIADCAAERDPAFLRQQAELAAVHLGQAPTAQEVDHALFLQDEGENTPPPMSLHQARQHRRWQDLMLPALQREVQQLHEYDVLGEAVPEAGLSNGDNLVLDAAVVFKVKREEGGGGRMSARLVARGDQEVPGLDFVQDGCGAPVIDQEALRLLCVIAARRGCDVVLCDISKAYLNARVTVAQVKEHRVKYIRLPREVAPTDAGGRPLVHRLLRWLYGLHFSAKAWHEELAGVMAVAGLFPTDASWALFANAERTLFAACHVDDIMWVGPREQQARAVEILIEHFALSRLVVVGEEPAVFCGFTLRRESGSGDLLVGQPDKIKALHARFPGPPAWQATPLAAKPCAADSERLDDAQTAQYRSLVGLVLHIHQTSRPEIARAVSVLSSFLASPTRAAHEALLHLVGYLAATADRELRYSCQGGSELDVMLYADAGGVPVRAAVLALCAGVAVRTFSKCLKGSAELSTVRAELGALAEAVKAAEYFRVVLLDLGLQRPGDEGEAFTVCCDSRLACCIAQNKVTSNVVKSDLALCRYVQDAVERGLIRTQKVTGEANLADGFTKYLPAERFEAHARCMRGLVGEI